MTNDELAAIEQRRDAMLTIMANDIAALIAEVKRLNAENEALIAEVKRLQAENASLTSLLKRAENAKTDNAFTDQQRRIAQGGRKTDGRIV